MDEQMQEKYNCRLGLDYPHPIRDPTIGELKRKKRYLRRKGVDWSEEGMVVSKEPVSKLRNTTENKTSNAVKETGSTQDDDDWYRDMNLLNEEGNRKEAKWNVSLDDVADEEWSNSSTTATKDSL
jgi:hypothetical protein